jgi:hypothetical protein
MKAKTSGPQAPKKHSGQHSDILYFLSYCIEQGDTTPEAAAYRIYENDWMSPDSKTGSDIKTLTVDCKRSWAKALQQTEAGVTTRKRLKDFEKLIHAKDWVDNRVTYDTFLGRYLSEGIETGPAAEYNAYNATADDLTFIEKHYFQNAFEVDRMPRVSTVKTWGESLPKWDRKDWIKELIKYVPARNPEQAELYLKGWLIRAYIQAVNPEQLDCNSIVNRWFLILYQHRQESGKSGFFRWLSPYPEWVKENGLEDDKDGYIALARYLFVLDDELGILSRVSQLERLKSMISISKIDVRLPYGKADVRFDRVASFCGSTNNEDIFPPSEGTTRFLVLPLTEESFDWKAYTKKIDRTKLWAQVKYLASTDWLEKNSSKVVSHRVATNADFIKEDLETFVVQRYLRANAEESTLVLRAGDIMRVFCGTDYGYNNLVLGRLGQALKKAFGERVNGLNLEGDKCKGYKLRILPADAKSQTNEALTKSQRKTPVSSTVAGKRLFAKNRKKSQR